MIEEEKIELDEVSPAAEKISYKLETYEGPLDLLLALIHKNKMKIEDIQISVICEQYFAYLARAEELNLELTAEFIVMASELMLIKSRMLLPREEAPEDAPEEDFRLKLLRKELAQKRAAALGERFKQFHGRMEKEPEDISPDRTYVAENQDAHRLYELMCRMLSEVRNTADIADSLVKPLVARPMVSVELKILGILRHFEGRTDRSSSLGELLLDADNRSELVAIFIGVLELVRMHRLIMVKNEDEFETLGGTGTQFVVNPDYADNPGEGLNLDEYAEKPVGDEKKK